MTVRVPTLLGAAAAALAGACGRAPEPVWTPLAVSRAPAAATEGDPALHTAADGTTFRLVSDAGGSWLETDIDASAWTASAFDDSWEAPLPVQGIGLPTDGTPPQRLVADGRELRWIPPTSVGPAMEREPGTFAYVFGRVFVFTEPGAGPPSDARASLHATRGHEENGAWRVELGRIAGDGLPVWPGQREALRVDVPPGAALRFATCGRTALVDPDHEEEVTFRVTLDGEELWSHDQRLDAAGTARWHEVALPARPDATLSFEVDGALAYTAFVAPRIGPREVGGYGDRPWSAERPDIVVFLADTFRADNLASFGGTSGLTPAIDAFAEGARRHARTWSTATHTLPAHGSLFAGLYPRQHAASGWEVALPDDVHTVAERLAEHGYRTGAVTDSVMVSSLFGVDQGFEWFDELHADLDSTLERARAFLDADDGRPTFLYVQTYRTHTPYHVDEATRERWGSELGLAGVYEEWERRLPTPNGAAPPSWFASDEGREVVRGLRALYRGTVRDLDRGFDAFVRDLDARGLDDRAYRVFVSDHGEAFGEHDELFHSGRVYDEQTRVPLLIRGPEVAAADVAFSSSLIDFAPTLCQMANVAPDPRWLGRSLLSLDAERPLFAFQSYADPSRSSLAMIEDGRKVLTLEDAERLEAGFIAAAFDTGLDPGELDDVAGGDDPWPRELFHRNASAARTLLIPLFGTRAAVLSAQNLEDLRAMGYGGAE